MDVLKDTKINKVYKGKSGDFGYGQVTFWSIYMQGSELKFSYAQKEHMAPPVEGTPIAKIVYEEKQSGEYTNYNITEMVTGEGGEPDTSSENRHRPHTPKPPPQPDKPGAIDPGPFSMNFSYVKDVACALIARDMYTENALEDIMAVIAKVTLKSVTSIKNMTPPAPLPKPQNDYDEPENIPF